MDGPHSQLEQVGDHLYNTPDFLSKPLNKSLHTEGLASGLSQNPNVNNTRSVSSSVTLITTPSDGRPFPVCIWLGTVQLLLSITLAAVGALVLARGAALSGAGAGFWAGGVCGIAGALGVINVRKAQTGFLAVSLICVATSTLALALTGIGLVRDLNLVGIYLCIS